MLNHKYISDIICEINIITMGDNSVKESNKRTEELIGRCEDTGNIWKVPIFVEFFVELSII